MFPAAMVLPIFNGQPLVSLRPAASASAEIPCVWQCVAHDLHHHFVTTEAVSEPPKRASPAQRPQRFSPLKAAWLNNNPCYFCNRFAP